MTILEADTSEVATRTVRSPVAPGDIKTTKFLLSSKTPEAHTKVEQNTVLGHESISALALTSVKTFSSSTVKTNRESTFFFKSTAKQLASEDYKLITLTTPTSEPEKEQKSSGLVIGLSIFFTIVLIPLIFIVVCCIRKKSKVERRIESSLT
ncbi:uncharacterized protein [Emydura macquarii macquarii]|uniref:uncharacterized protein isoform X2 n=1 Tax=Emydura macquarii macquarii TaxID=1129001 RepID=UPI00352A35C4